MTWSEERRRAQAARMTEIAKRPRPPMSEKQRQAKSAFMRELNQRAAADPELKAKIVAGQKRIRSTPEARERQSLHMQVTMADPKNRDAARQHVRRLNRDPDVRKKQNRSRFGADQG